MNAISRLMEKHKLERVEDLLNNKSLLGSLPLTKPDLAFLHDVRRCTAAALENTLVLMEARQKGNFREAWSKIGENIDPAPE